MSRQVLRAEWKGLGIQGILDRGGPGPDEIEDVEITDDIPKALKTFLEETHMDSMVDKLMEAK